MEAYATQAQVGALQDTMNRFHAIMEKVADAITRLAVLEEKHANVIARVTRLDQRADTGEERVKQLEVANIRLVTISVTLQKAARAFWAVCGVGILAGAAAVLKSAGVFFMAN